MYVCERVREVEMGAERANRREMRGERRRERTHTQRETDGDRVTETERQR